MYSNSVTHLKWMRTCEMYYKLCSLCISTTVCIWGTLLNDWRDCSCSHLWKLKTCWLVSTRSITCIGPREVSVWGVTTLHEHLNFSNTDNQLQSFSIWINGLFPPGFYSWIDVLVSFPPISTTRCTEKFDILSFMSNYFLSLFNFFK